MADNAALSLNAVTKRFGGVTATDNVSFDVPAGARMALIGPNGAGKTSLFNLISGVYPVDAGSILLEGKPIQAHAAAAARPRRTGPIVSEYSADAASFRHRKRHARPARASQRRGGGARPLAWQRANQWRRLAENSLRDAGIDVDPDADVSTLSYGIRKRIEVVRALMSRPRLLMLDEPAAGLNTRETAELSAFLKSVARDGVTLLVVEHDMSFIHDLCEQTVVLNFGRLIYQGPTTGVHDDEEVRAAYLGRRRVSAAGASTAT